MRENWLLLLIAALLGGFTLAGCTVPKTQHVRSFIPDSHIIFNPYLNTPVVAGTDRSGWPVVLASDDPNAEVYFRESIYDRQGDFSNDRDYYFRRVDSTRTRKSGR